MNDINNTSAANTKNLSTSFKAQSATKYLWSGDSERCKCSHHIADHSRNDDPREGRCVMRDCHCKYFDPYRHISQEVYP